MISSSRLNAYVDRKRAITPTISVTSTKIPAQTSGLFLSTGSTPPPGGISPGGDRLALSLSDTGVAVSMRTTKVLVGVTSPAADVEVATGSKSSMVCGCSPSAASCPSAFLTTRVAVGVGGGVAVSVGGGGSGVSVGGSGVGIKGVTSTADTASS